MKAIVQDTYGSADVLQYRDIDEPTAGEGRVLVRVRAAGVDPGVWHLMVGRPYLVRPVFGIRRPRERVRGWAVAGEVDSVGEGVTRFRPGDAVMGVGRGSFAELVACKERNLARKPSNASFEQAAAVPISATTALQGVRDHGRVTAGQSVLIIGASGGVGSFAVQIAKALGAEVTGVCGTANVDFVRSLGADEVIDYTKEEIGEGGKRYDVILDNAGNRALSALRHALVADGTLVIIGGEQGGRWLGGTERGLRAIVTSPFVKQRLVNFVAKDKAEDLESLAEMIEGGAIRAIVDRTFPLSAAPDAITYLEVGHPRGKVVVTV
jgi:NADPH:quinone reductase-like Zn-dependent oxidoreductase